MSAPQPRRVFAYQSLPSTASGVGPWVVLVPNWPYSGRTREVGHGVDSDT